MACRLVAQDKGISSLTIAFTLIFIKPVNFVIKKAIENGEAAQKQCSLVLCWRTWI